MACFLATRVVDNVASAMYTTKAFQTLQAAGVGQQPLFHVGSLEVPGYSATTQHGHWRANAVATPAPRSTLPSVGAGALLGSAVLAFAGLALRVAQRTKDIGLGEHWAMSAMQGHVSRREVGLAVLGTAVSLSTQPATAFPQEEEMDPIPATRYIKLPSGVVYADAKTGTGNPVEVGDRVSLQWVLRRSNGYFVDSSNVSGGEPFQFVVGDPAGAIEGLDEAVRGMQSGGVRRVLIPPRLAYVQGVDDGKPGPLPVGFGPRQQVRRVMEVRRDVPGEYIFLEVELSRIYPGPR
eukprot:EG_transcript_17184